MKALRSLLQFATIVPLGKPVDLIHFARRLYLYPIAGYLIGGIAAIVVWKIGPHSLAAALALVLVLFLSGFHHFDGLLDFGDAVMAHGNRENRIRALTDTTVGAGGVGLGVSITLLAFGALQGTPSPGITILIAEVCAKTAMAGMTIFGSPFKDGMHRYLHQYSHPWFIIPSYLLLVPLLLLPINPLALVGAGLTTATITLVMLAFASHVFGGVNGDVTGATNEITRAFVIITLVLLT